jgi:membrane fusion protein, copper/silver efflux system
MKYASYLFAFLLLVSCGKNTQHNHQADPNIVYTCSMDPQVRESHPGPCPICHMPLTPVKRSALSEEGVIELSEQQIKLGGITVDTVGVGSIGSEQTLTATLVENPENVVSVNARLGGRIEALNVKATGIVVTKGQTLYRLYSEELYNTQRDYLNALRRKDSIANSVIDFSLIAQSAKNKMLLWGVTEKQIRELESTRNPKTSLDIYSPASGLVTELYKREGEYVMNGEPLMRLADYATLWAETQLYAYNVAAYKNLRSVFVTMPDGKKIKANVEFVAPQTAPGSQLITVRLRVPNEGTLYRPGSAVTVRVLTKPSEALTVPKSAVIHDEMGASVWVQDGERRYRVRMVELGNESNDLVLVKNGLTAGDVVVVGGAYLLNSEYVLRKGTSAHSHAM